MKYLIKSIVLISLICSQVVVEQRTNSAGSYLIIRINIPLRSIK
ncbi:hypothetical protein [Pedobacter cryoconitis]|uniref:Uncharacterized protein n=1 Tax=Pedobacter cryoconitis TaxID=188932 RepID=A0A7X0MIA8_9SPHI|nr:hypothetical protein [Pedobacter cryoconitis]MBB6498335.1 hypothetical protein [Pedobacter cryoconitis]